MRYTCIFAYAVFGGLVLVVIGLLIFLDVF